MKNTAPYDNAPPSTVAFQTGENESTRVSAETPLPVAVISGGGGGGGGTGTEYTEDAAAPANPIGGTLVLRRKDTLSAAEVSADGDFVAINSTAKGEMVTRDGDAIAELQAIKGGVGATNETAPGTDTATVGLNGRLQRVAQRLTSLIGLLPTSLGGKTAANSLAVTIASDQGEVASKTADGSNLALGAKADAAWSTGAGSVVALLKAIAGAAVDTTTPSPVRLAGQTEYETVAASATATVLGAAGATGDFISHLLVIPATTSPGNVLLLDNATSITVFAGGASSVSNLAPFVIPLNMKSVSGAWKVTTGANVSVIAVGDFT